MPLPITIRDVRNLVGPNASGATEGGERKEAIKVAEELKKFHGVLVP